MMIFLIRISHYKQIRNSIPDADCHNGDQYSIRVEFSDDVRIYDDKGKKVNKGVLEFNKGPGASKAHWSTTHIEMYHDPNKDCVVIITK